ncbi:GTPase domain-containing protein [uncultured Pseudokineococcus sp.]|uniref:GTPase domain-containing protein n=1 Tax=uncultured Pseudokineococcus sp. TaxID=1642928 RepID=UPI00262714E0|nr:GTPase domain-containing protein [uncultured Pseudokineococcus sp.]
MSGAGDGGSLLEALERLREELAGLRLPLDLSDAQRGRAGAAAARDQLDDYLLPRLRQVDAPLLAVVGGSTGAGKSTLVNSLLRERVTRAGALRPTTRAPVLAHHPDDAAWFIGDRVLPALARTTGAEEPTGPARADAPAATSLQLVASPGVPAGLALLDAPDVDSVVDANRALAAQLLGAADLWVFVTTAARYADAVPWDLLSGAARRGASVAVVLDRVPAGPGDDAVLREVRADLAGMLRDGGLGAAPLFSVLETAPGADVDGLLPAEAVEPLRRWLAGLAGDARQRALVVRRTLTGALEALPSGLAPVAGAAAAQAAAVAALRDDVVTSFAQGREELETELTDGTLLRGEVLARWQEFVGTGEFFRSFDAAVGRLRDRLGALVRGRPAPSAEPVGQAVRSGVAALVRARVAGALDRTRDRWLARPAGAQAVAVAGPVLDLPPDFDERVARLVRDWQRGVLDLVRAEGEGRRTRARVLSFGVNALGVALMVVVFASTAFIPTGAEVGVGVGAAAVGQRVLEAVFGDAAVRALAARARADLLRRVDELVDGPRLRLLEVLDSTGVDAGAAGRLERVLADVAAARGEAA